MADQFRTSIPCLSPASLAWPDRLVASGWLEHVPFAFWLMDRLRPRLFVELGTYTGASYLAFCQSAKENAVDCSCYGIDTWQGDPHSGRYGESVYQELREHHDQRYGDFSKLHRGTFDSAVSIFPDGSIQLLHIDGYHSYEAVKHDFETWQPKLASDAVVLFHDTQVRRDNFGVHRYWHELTSKLPAFEFIHGNGLGVLAARDTINPRLAELFAASNSPTSETIRKTYSALGKRLGQAIMIEQLRKKSDQLQKSVEIYKTQVQNRTTQLGRYVELIRKQQADRRMGQSTSLPPQAIPDFTPRESGNEIAKKRIIVLYHVYKAGGSSIIHALRQQYGASSLLELDKHPGYAGEKAYNICFFEKVVQAHPDVVAYTAHRVVPNIHFSTKLDVYPIIFVRHPLLRAMSVYRFERVRRDEWPRKEFALKYDFAGWIDWCLSSDQLIEGRNYQTCLLSISDEGEFINSNDSSLRRGDLALVYRRLDAMPVVGVVEMFRSSIGALSRAGQSLFPGLNIAEARVNSTKVVDDWHHELSAVEHLLPNELRNRFYEANADDLALFERYRVRLPNEHGARR